MSLEECGCTERGKRGMQILSSSRTWWLTGISVMTRELGCLGESDGV